MTDENEHFDDNTLAAEYVLRLLDGSERAQFEARMKDDADLRALVYQWEIHLASIANEVEEVAPPAAIKAAILEKIAPVAPTRRRWITGLFGAGLAATFAFAILGPTLDRYNDPQPEFQAELVSDDRALILVASVIPATHEIVIERLAGNAPPGRVLELWLIADDAPAPVSLGLLEASGTTRIRVPDDIAPGVRTGTIAISEEPPGGSPSDVPTGQILATSAFEDI